MLNHRVQATINVTNRTRSSRPIRYISLSHSHFPFRSPAERPETTVLYVIIFLFSRLLLSNGCMLNIIETIKQAVSHRLCPDWMLLPTCQLADIVDRNGTT